MTINQQEVSTAREMLKCLSNQFTNKIILVLDECGELNVTDIISKSGIGEQSVVSQHLTKLRKYNIVTRRAEGKERFYSLNKSKVIGLCDLAEKICKL